MQDIRNFILFFLFSGELSVVSGTLDINQVLVEPVYF